MVSEPTLHESLDWWPAFPLHDHTRQRITLHRQPSMYWTLATAERSRHGTRRERRSHARVLDVIVACVWLVKR